MKYEFIHISDEQRLEEVREAIALASKNYGNNYVLVEGKEDFGLYYQPVQLQVGEAHLMVNPNTNRHDG